MNLSTIAMGHLETQRGNFPQAQTHLDDALGPTKLVGHQWDLGMAYETLGNLYDAEGALELAEESFGTCLAISDAAGFGELSGYALYRLGRIAAQRGQIDRVRQLGGKSLQILETIGYWEAGTVREWLSYQLH